jgi:hypothetical protein
MEDLKTRYKQMEMKLQCYEETQAELDENARSVPPRYERASLI